MRDSRLRSYVYSCHCGYSVKVFLDTGVPQEIYRCRRCGQNVKRTEV